MIRVFFCIFAITCLVFSCSKDHQLYEGVKQLPGSVAIIIVDQDTHVHNIDGKRVGGGLTVYKTDEQIEVLPGRHTARIAYFHKEKLSPNTIQISRSSPMNLIFDVEKGRSYLIRAVQMEDGKCKPEIVEFSR